MDPAQQALSQPDRPLYRSLRIPMDAGLPIVAQQNAPSLPSNKLIGMTTTGVSAKGPLVGFEAMLAALFGGQNKQPSDVPAIPAVGAITKTPSPSGQLARSDAPGEDDFRVATAPGRSPKTLSPTDGASDPALASIASTPGAQLLASLQIVLPTKPDQPVLVPANPGETTPSRTKVDLPLSIPDQQDLQVARELNLGRRPAPAAEPASRVVGPKKGSAQTSNLPAQLPALTETSRGTARVRELSAPATYTPAALAQPTPVIAQSAQASLTQVANLKPRADGIAAADSAARNRGPAKTAGTGLGAPSTAASSSVRAGPQLSHAVVGPVVNNAAPDTEAPPEDLVLAINPEAEKHLSEAGRDPTLTPVSPSTVATQSNAITVRAGPETVTNLAAHIIRNLEGRATRFDVELHPADLGRVDVRLEIGAHGRLKASMSFENPQAAADMRGRSEELQRALESAGFDISGGLNFDVAGDRGQGQNSSRQDTTTSNGASGRAFDAAMALAEGHGDSALASALNNYQVRRAAGLDIRI